MSVQKTLKKMIIVLSAHCFCLRTRKNEPVSQGTLSHACWFWLGVFGKGAHTPSYCLELILERVVGIQLQHYTVQTSSKTSKCSLWTQMPPEQSYAETNMYQWNDIFWQSFASSKFSRWLYGSIKGWKEVMLQGGGGYAGQKGAASFFPPLSDVTGATLSETLQSPRTPTPVF